WEVSDESLDLLPRAMHPAVPPYATLLVTSYSESPVGPFNLALLRLMGRAGAHPRGYVVAAVASTPDSVHALRKQWGFPAELGGITLRRYHDQVTAVVSRDSEPLVEAALINPEPISGGDVQYIHSVTLARLPEGDRPAPHLIQVDPHYTFRKAERGRPKVRRFDTEVWNAKTLAPLAPTPASITTSDPDLPHTRFPIDPQLPLL